MTKTIAHKMGTDEDLKSSFPLNTKKLNLCVVYTQRIQVDFGEWNEKCQTINKTNANAGMCTVAKERVAHFTQTNVSLR